VRRPLFGEPLIAHPAPCARVHATWHPHSANDYNRDQHDNYADNQQHMVLDLAAAPRPPTHCIDWTCSALFSLAQRTTARRLFFKPLGCAPKGHGCVALGLPVHSGTAPFSAGPYTCDVQPKSINATVATFWPASRPSAVHLMWRWNNPRRTMSETIQEALR
jgi:hypothetical protein